MICWFCTSEFFGRMIPTWASSARRKVVGVLSRHYSGSVVLYGKKYETDGWTNVTPVILSKTNIKLHNQKNNPICVLKKLAEKHFGGFKVFEFDDPVVSARDNFDELLFPSDHPGRSKNDTYYVNSNYLLRSHTSAHQRKILEKLRGQTECGGISTADVYRRDEIDSKHYPVFHQTELVRLYPSRKLSVNEIKKGMQESLEEFVKGLFARSSPQTAPLQIRWTDTYFPFTDPSWEMEIAHCGDWLEILGCGVMRNEILESGGRPKCFIEIDIGS